jgi:hypothetical protein
MWDDQHFQRNANPIHKESGLVQAPSGLLVARSLPHVRIPLPPLQRLKRIGKAADCAKCGKQGGYQRPAAI